MEDLRKPGDRLKTAIGTPNKRPKVIVKLRRPSVKILLRTRR